MYVWIYINSKLCVPSDRFCQYQLGEGIARHSE